MTKELACYIVFGACVLGMIQLAIQATLPRLMKYDKFSVLIKRWSLYNLLTWSTFITFTVQIIACLILAICYQN